jgi:thioredoxin reductase (NADPH)
MVTAAPRTDILVIGAGPVGLFAVFAAGMLGMKCHVVDVLDMVGGQCAALYPEKPIYDIPGYPEILAGDLVDKLARQAAPFNPLYHLGHQVTALAPRAGGGWRATTDRGLDIDAAVVVIAAGVGAFGPNRPPIPGIEAYEGRSVFYHVNRSEDLRSRRVVIAGGGDSAVDWAIALSGVAAGVTVVHRRAKFRAAPASERRLNELAAAGAIELAIPYQLVGLDGQDGRLTAVRIATLDGRERLVPADALLAFFGLAMNLGPIADWGLGLDRNRIVVDPASCTTDRAGLYAIGDIAHYPGKLKLIVTGFAEAAMATRAAYALARPGQALHTEYSTLSGVVGLP